MNRRSFLAALATAVVATRRLDFSAWAYLSPAPAPAPVTLADLARRTGSARTREVIAMYMRTNTLLSDIPWREV